MSDYLYGCDVLGATIDQTSPTVQQAIPLTYEQRMSLMDPDWVRKKANAADATRQNQMRSAASTLLISGIVGVLVGTLGGAMLWKTHRVAGALIGGLVVGPTLGYGTGTLLALQKAGK